MISYVMKKLPEELWEQVSSDVSREEKAGLKAVTSEYHIVEAEKPIAVIGVMPGSLISGRAALWFSFFGGHSPSLGELKKGKAVLENLVASKPSLTFQAEVMIGSKVEHRFARFFGFKQTRVLNDREILERNS